MKLDLPDGLYNVTTEHICAGFEVVNKHVTWCAPILRKHLAHWATRAERIADVTTPQGRALVSREWQ